jgi:transposase InsO family protein
LRVDTVHPGDGESAKGVYHINAVDEVTQWQVMGCTGQISEAWLLPALEAMLEQFPFRIRGFHSDNGSEFINHTVARLSNKLLIEQTKSRPRHSNDNGLVETKNGAVSLRSLLVRLSRIDVLVIDDWAMAPLAETDRRDFWESAKTVIKPVRRF